MSNSLYKGSSDGFNALCDGYVDYAKEVISRRSIPDLRDGLKPVGRRCIYGASLIKSDGLVKCLTLVGEISKFHPHGDSAVYGALCGMTDKNGSMNAPVFIGQGNLGKVYSSSAPAHARYPKAKLGGLAEDYLRDMDACTLIPAEEGDGVEPQVLPVRFPSALVNGTSGMAVSVSTSIPSFNLLDVLNLTQEYIRKGECSTLIAPDFPTGGILVRDDAELAKIMHTGKGKIKIRAKVEIEGKIILVKEVPYGKTTESIIKAINNLDIQGIQSVQDATGLNSDSLVKITCKTLKVVETVLMQLYKHRVLQTSFSSNMLFVENEEPVMTGVYGVIERWLAWRRGVVIKKYTQALGGIKEELGQLNYFIRLIQNNEWRDTYVDKVVRGSKSDGKEYLHEIFEDIPDSICDWISARSISAFNNGGRYLNRYNDLSDLQKQYTDYINNVDDYIYNDLEQLKSSRKEYLARKTEETYLDYRFSKISDSEIEDDSFCVYTFYADGFLTKTRDVADSSDKEVLASIPAQANSTLVGFDCFGRVLRVFGTEIPFTNKGEHGEYLPKYFEADGYDGYKITYLGLLDGKKRMLVYRDGFIGFLDTSEWVGKKKIRVVQKGVDVNVYNALVEVIEEDDFPEYLVVAEDSGKKIRFGVTKVSEIREASRKSRAKVFGGSNLDIRYVAGMTYMELLQFMEEPFYYVDRLRPLGNREVYGDAATIMKEGRYYGK